jgi:hypothetical protein
MVSNGLTLMIVCGTEIKQLIISDRHGKVKIIFGELMESKMLQINFKEKTFLFM